MTSLKNVLLKTFECGLLLRTVFIFLIKKLCSTVSEHLRCKCEEYGLENLVISCVCSIILPDSLIDP